MNKTTKILLIIMAVSLVPLGMLGAMLYFGGTADSPVGGTIDLSKVTAEAGGGTYTGGSDSTTDGSISYGTVNSTTDGNISDGVDAGSAGMDVRPQLTTITAASMYQSFLTVCGRTCRGRAIRRAALLSVKTCAMFMSCMWTSREEAVRASWL